MFELASSSSKKQEQIFSSELCLSFNDRHTQAKIVQWDCELMVFSDGFSTF